MQILNTKLFYPSGRLRYEGTYIPDYYEKSTHLELYLEGTLYYENGNIWKRGKFQSGGLLEGEEYYPDGKLMFQGMYNDRSKGVSYYGPSYPLYGLFYDEQGNLVYNGKVRIGKSGNLAYPHVVLPDGRIVHLK